MMFFAFMLLGTVYSYLLYPLLLAALTYLRRDVKSTPDNTDPPPGVSLIVTAHNEENRIRAKLENSLSLSYPALEILVASDCSSDDTDRIVAEFASRKVVLVRAPQRLGKEFAQKCAIERSSGEIIVFSDVGTELEPNAIASLVDIFRDHRIGAISSEDRFVREDGSLVGEGAYVHYEMFLRRLESSVAGLVGLSGSFFAARRVACDPWDIQSPSDFNTALNCARLTLKAVTAPDIHGYYKDLANPADEYRRKVRTLIRGMTGLARHWEMMLPWRHGLFAWQLFSHKLMRWLVPFFLVGLFAATVALQQSIVFRALLAAQVGFYALAIATHLFPAFRSATIPRLAYFFCQVNVAIVHAGINFVLGRRMTVWRPSER